MRSRRVRALAAGMTGIAGMAGMALAAGCAGGEVPADAGSAGPSTQATTEMTETADAASAPATTGPDAGMRLVDSVTVPAGQRFGGTTIGGLSGIDYDPDAGRYVVVSDDKGEYGLARAYTLTMPLGPDGGLTQPQFTAMIPLGAPGGGTYPDGASDTESVRLTPDGGLLYGSEGYGLPGQPGSREPFLRASGPDGAFRRDYPLPAAFEPQGDASGSQTSGLRPNLGFEGLALSDDGATISAIGENALIQDGPAAAPDTPSPSRLLRIDRATGAAEAEYVYETDPMRTSGTVIGPSVAGVSAMTQADATTYLTVERSFAFPKGFSVRIYRATTDGADDVAGKTALDGTENAMRKTELFDFAEAGVSNNIEGITFGPKLPDGNRSLVLVADDNFGQVGSTTFYLLDAGRGGR